MWKSQRRAWCWGYVCPGMDPASSLEGGDHSSMASFPLSRPLCLFSECGEYQDLVESVLGEKLHLEEGKLAEQWALAEKLR